MAKTELARPDRAVSGRGRGSRVTRPVRTVGMVLACWAVLRELRRPPAERTWHGMLAGVVPYDLRWPTLTRVRERMWAPEDARIVMPRVLGVGWTLNLGRVVRLLRDRFGRRCAGPGGAEPAGAESAAAGDNSAQAGPAVPR
jgi:hypothetical protein